MANTVGPKGQVVIAKEIRDRLGVLPGSIALQSLVDDHVEIAFLPPPHRRSLKGSLASEIRRHIGAGRDWERAREDAWQQVVRDRKSEADTDEGDGPL